MQNWLGFKQLKPYQRCLQGIYFSILVPSASKDQVDHHQ
jgi:hypothetical protein